MPGEPAFAQQTQPPKAIPLDAVCGPRKPGNWPRSSAAAGAEEPATKVQRYKAPPLHRVPLVEAGPPPAGPSGQTGHATQSSAAASGTTSKSSAPKAPPPTLPGTEVSSAQSAAQPARLPAGMLATQTAIAAPTKEQPAAKQETTAEAKQEVTPAPKQLAAVAEAAKVLLAHGFTLTDEQKEALEAQATAAAATGNMPPVMRATTVVQEDRTNEYEVTSHRTGGKPATHYETSLWTAIQRRCSSG
eukprot:6438916-Amphidinium_carterae.1